MATSGKIDDMPFSFQRLNNISNVCGSILLLQIEPLRPKQFFCLPVGSAAFSLIETLVAPADIEDEAITFDIIQTTILDHLRPKQILHYERHQLHSLFQNTDSISTYLQHLKDQANRCHFGELHKDLILSQFIFSLSSQDVRTKLLSTTELSLNAAVQMVTLSETVLSAASTCHQPLIHLLQFQSSLPLL